MALGDLTDYRMNCSIGPPCPRSFPCASRVWTWAATEQEPSLCKRESLSNMARRALQERTFRACLAWAANLISKQRFSDRASSAKTESIIYRSRFWINSLRNPLDAKRISISCNVALGEPRHFPATSCRHFVDGIAAPAVGNWPTFRGFPVSPFRPTSCLTRQPFPPPTFTEGTFSPSPVRFPVVR
jgi:hypothetical protein